MAKNKEVVDKESSIDNKNAEQNITESKESKKEFKPNITDALVTTVKQCINIKEVYFYEVGYSFHKIPEKTALVVKTRDEILNS